jgi:hypothetical protein
MAIWILLLCSLAGWGGLVYSVVAGNSWGNMLVQAGAGLVCGALFLHFWRARRADQALMAWLREHADEVTRGAGTYRGRTITRATPLRQFDGALSLIVVSFRFHSRYYVEGEPRGLAGLIYTAGTLLLGWWGIPWGPVFTVRALANNLRGGRRLHVGDVLSGGAAPPQGPPARVVGG